MELLHADEYITCIKAGRKPDLAVAGSKVVTDGLATTNGKYFLTIEGSLYEVKPDFVLFVQWRSVEQEPSTDQGQTLES